jgi:hypothetical protein
MFRTILCHYIAEKAIEVATNNFFFNFQTIKRQTIQSPMIWMEAFELSLIVNKNVPDDWPIISVEEIYKQLVRQQNTNKFYTAEW